MRHVLSIALVASIVFGVVSAAANKRPDPHDYRPYLFWTTKDPFHIKTYGYYMWRDGRAGASWAICYWFIWNGETDYDNTGRDKREDPEPVVVFVSNAGKVVGVQTRVHKVWLPIASVSSKDLNDGKHVYVFFNVVFGNYVHTPVLGSLALDIVRALAKKRLAYEKGTDYGLTKVDPGSYPLHP